MPVWGVYAAALGPEEETVCSYPGVPSSNLADEAVHGSGGSRISLYQKEIEVYDTGILIS